MAVVASAQENEGVGMGLLAFALLLPIWGMVVVVVVLAVRADGSCPSGGWMLAIWQSGSKRKGFHSLLKETPGAALPSEAIAM